MERGYIMVLLPNSNIIVDEFRYSGDPSRPQFVFFLTHMHSDHYGGLTDQWAYGPIYCSPVTKTLLLRKFPGLTSVHALDLDEQHWVSLKSDHSIGVSVTLIDARHCPGSVMFLFQGEMGTILHTGDFRYGAEMLLHPALSNSAGDRLEVDLLYLDNTYCHPRFDFPVRSEAVEMIKAIVEEEKGAEIIVGTNCLGKEEAIIALAGHFHVKVHVSAEKFAELQAIGHSAELFTCDPNATWLHQEDRSALGTIPEQLKEGKQVIGLKLSGWCQREKINSWLYAVPYSLHSNYQELVTFVEGIKPNNVVFTVAKSANSPEAAEFLLKYSYKAPMKHPQSCQSAFPSVVSGSLKRKLPSSQQVQVRKKAKVLGSRICN